MIDPLEWVMVRTARRYGASWPAWLLVGVVNLLMGISLDEAGWVENSAPLTGSLLWGLLLGLLLARSRFPGWFSLFYCQVMALIYSLQMVGSLAPPLTMLTSRPAVEVLALLNARLLVLGERLRGWVDAVSSGGSVRDTGLFVLLVGLLAWNASAWLAWAFIRRRRALQGLLPYGVLFGLNVQLSDQSLWLFAAFLACALPMAARTDFNQVHADWERRQVDYPDELGLNWGGAALGLALAVALSARLFVFVATPEGWNALEEALRPLRQSVEDTSARWFSEVNPPRYNPTPAGTARPSAQAPQLGQVGAPPSQGSAIVMWVSTDGPLPPPPDPDEPGGPQSSVPVRYWRSEFYATYTGTGWLPPAFGDVTFPPPLLAPSGGASQGEESGGFGDPSSFPPLLSGGSAVGFGDPSSLPLLLSGGSAVGFGDPSSLPLPLSGGSAAGFGDPSSFPPLLSEGSAIGFGDPSSFSPLLSGEGAGGEVNHTPPLLEGEVGRGSLTQTFEILAEHGETLFAASAPEQASAGLWLRRSVPDGSHLLGGYLSSYTVRSLVTRTSEAALLAAPATYPPELAATYLQLPPGLPQRVRELASRLAAGTSSPYEMAMRIQSYLRATYPYRLDTPLPPSGSDVVDYFLFQAPGGFCSYYASAMAVMLRSLGVPARVASGYAMGRFDYQRQAYAVTLSDAHAWVEVYFPNAGWVEFEPTAGLPAIIYEKGGTAGPAPLPDLPPATPPATFPWTALLVVALVLAGLAGLFYFALRKPPPAPTPQGEVQELYARMRARLARIGLRAPASTTPAEFTARALQSLPPGSLLAAVDQVTTIYEEAVYSPRPPTPERAARARQAWHHARRDWLVVWLRAKFAEMRGGTSLLPSLNFKKRMDHRYRG